VAEWLTHSPAMLQVSGACPSFGDSSEINFSNGYTVSGKEGLQGGTKMVCVALQEFTETLMSEVTTGKQITSLPL